MRTICAVLLHGFLAAAAQPGVMGTGAANTDTDGALTGVYALSFHPGTGALPPGAMYVCRARIMPGAGAGQPAIGSGSGAGCALEVPFVWQANRPQPVATLSYEVDAVGADGRVMRSVTRKDVALPAPAAGGKARVELTF